jgi:hypothetical protein
MNLRPYRFLWLHGMPCGVAGYSRFHEKERGAGRHKADKLDGADAQYGLDGVPPLGIGDGPVDVAEIVEFQ